MPTTKRSPRKTKRPMTKAKPAPKKKKTGGKVALLSGGNPQIAKGYGDAPVKAYIVAIPRGWKHDLAHRIDALITKTVSGVRKAVKWNSPFYGAPGQDGWFANLHCFNAYVKVAFFRGTSLRPLPPGASKLPGTRYADIREGELDEKQLAAWIKQAAELPGLVM